MHASLLSWQTRKDIPDYLFHPPHIAAPPGTAQSPVMYHGAFRFLSPGLSLDLLTPFFSIYSKVWLVWYHHRIKTWVALGYCLKQQSYQLLSSLYKRYWLKLRSRFICLCSVKEDPFLARVVLCDLLKPTFVLSFESDRFGAKIIGDMLLSSINWSQCIGRVSNFEGNFVNLPVHWHLGCSRKLSNWQCN